MGLHPDSNRVAGAVESGAMASNPIADGLGSKAESEISKASKVTPPPKGLDVVNNVMRLNQKN